MQSLERLSEPGSHADASPGAMRDVSLGRRVVAAIPMTRLAPASLVLGLAVVAGASASPIDDCDEPRMAVETASASFPNRSSVAGNEELARAAGWLSDDAGARGSNPLSMIPMSALNATRDRPLFSVSRRPAVAVQAVPPPPRPPDPAPAAPAPPEQPILKLVGTIVSSKASVAMFRDPATHAVTRLREGEATAGWQLITVELRSVIVEKGEQSATLNLPNPLDTSGEQPSSPLALGVRPPESPPP